MDRRVRPRRPRVPAARDRGRRPVGPRPRRPRLARAGGAPRLPPRRADRRRRAAAARGARRGGAADPPPHRPRPARGLRGAQHAEGRRAPLRPPARRSRRADDRARDPRELAALGHRRHSHDRDRARRRGPPGTATRGSRRGSRPRSTNPCAGGASRARTCCRGSRRSHPSTSSGWAPTCSAARSPGCRSPGWAT